MTGTYLPSLQAVSAQLNSDCLPLFSPESFTVSFYMSRVRRRGDSTAGVTDGHVLRVPGRRVEPVRCAWKCRRAGFSAASSARYGMYLLIVGRQHTLMTFCGFPVTSKRSRARTAMHPARVGLAAAVDDWYVPVCVVLQIFLLTVQTCRKRRDRRVNLAG